MSVILTLLSGVLSGGATGLLGVLLQRFFDMKAKQQEIEIVKLNHQNALALAQMESDRARMRADAEIRMADREAEAREEEAAGRSLIASYEHDKAMYLEKGYSKRKGFWGGAVVFMMAFVDFARGMLRPGMTVYLTAIVTVMFLKMLDLLHGLGHQFTSGEVMPILTNIVATVLYCFTTCIVWWFGSRPPKKAGDR